MNLIKKYWKRLNRGMILAIIIVLVIAVHTVVTNKRYKNNKKAVYNTAVEFCEGFGKLKLFNCEGKLSEKELDAAVDAAMDYVDRYWTDEQLKNTDYERNRLRSKEGLKTLINDFANANKAGRTIVNSYNIKMEDPSEYLTSLSTSRFGTRGIKVSVDFTYSINWTGADDKITTIAGTTFDSGNSYEYEYDDQGRVIEESVETAQGVAERSSGDYQSAVIYFIYTDGEWKIAAMSADTRW